VDGRAPRPGERFRNPAAARTLSLIATSKAEAFYRGEVAEAIVAHAARTGGLCTVEDLAGHSSLWTEPLSVDYHGYQVWELPPNGQGLAVLLTLAILDGVDLSDAAESRRVHTQLEAMKLGFADAHAFVADPELAPAPLEGLREKSYVESRRALLGRAGGRAASGGACPRRDGLPVRGRFRRHDGESDPVELRGLRFLCSRTRIWFWPAEPGSRLRFGTGPPERGGAGQATVPHDHSRVPHPRWRARRPVRRDGRSHAAAGARAVRDVHRGRGLDPQAALDAPRWYWEQDLRVQVEPEWSDELVAALRQRGHEVGVAMERGVFGRGQAIFRLPDGAGYVAGSEPRADGHAAVF
jgi:gamma-glutamyltranspeptidase/glutathione hydrolase